jgi:hypothetical protein
MKGNVVGDSGLRLRAWELRQHAERRKGYNYRKEYGQRFPTRGAHQGFSSLFL